MLEYAGLSSWHADRQRLAVCHAKLDDISAVALRTVNHDAVLAARRSHAHLRRSFDQSSSASRLTTGASDDVAEVRGLGFASAWVKHSPPKRLRNASAVAVSTRERVMAGQPQAAPLLELAERAERLGFDSVFEVSWSR